MEGLKEKNKIEMDSIKPINLLMSAISKNNVQEVKQILENFLIVNSDEPVDETITIKINEKLSNNSPGQLAWENKNYEILLLLLENNSKFPFNKSDLKNIESVELIKFTETMNSFHRTIYEQDTKKLNEIIDKYPKLRNFYSIHNVSALTQALKTRKYDIYNLFIAKGLQFGIDENIYNHLKPFDKKTIRNCPTNFQGHIFPLKNLVKENLNVILENSQVIDILMAKKLEIGTELKSTDKFMNCLINIKNQQIVRGPLNFYEKSYIIADYTQSGKTTAAKKLGILFKNVEPIRRWIAYFDLKTQWKKEFLNFDDLKKVLCRSKLDETLFMSAYTNNSVIFLWDNADSLSGENLERFLDITTTIKTHSFNYQFVITLPSLVEKLKKLDDTNIYQMMGFENEKSRYYLELKIFEKEINVNMAENFEKSNTTSTDCEDPFYNLDSKILSIDEKILDFTENLAKVNFFETPKNPKFLNLIVDFGYSRDFCDKFSSSIEFYEKFISWKFKCIENWRNFNEETLHKTYQSIALKKFVNNENFKIFVTEGGSELSSLQAANINVDFDKLPDCGLFENESFLDTSLDIYFIAKYAFENAFYIDDFPSDEEKALRVNLMLTLASTNRIVYSFFNSLYLKFLVEFIERDHKNSKYKKCQKRKFFNSSLYHLPEFKHALINLLVEFHDSPTYVENFSNIFKHDKETLNFLWRIDENETFFNFWVKEFLSTQSDSNLSEILKKYFKKDEIERIRNGKYQLGNSLFRIFVNKGDHPFDSKEKAEEKEKYDDVIEFSDIFKETFEFIEIKTENQEKTEGKIIILSKAITEGNFNFFKFLEFVEPHLTPQEFLEIFIRNSHYIFYHFVKTLDDFNEIWMKIERIASKEEISEILRAHRRRKYLIFKNAVEGRDPEFLETFIEKIENFLNEKEIIEHFFTTDENLKSPLSLAIWSKSRKVFEIFWKFILKYLKGEELKKNLLSLDNEKYAAFHHAIVCGNDKIFELILELYQNHLEDFRKLFNHERFFLTRVIANSSIKICEFTAGLIENLYGEDRDTLKKFFQNDDYIFYSYKNQEVYRKKLKLFLGIFKKSFSSNSNEQDQLDEVLLWDDGFENKFDCDDEVDEDSDF